jgi:hypothetical protein
MRYALVIAAIVGLSPALGLSHAFDTECRGECVGNGNARNGTECFSDAESQTLDQIVPILNTNGTTCPLFAPITGVRVLPATGGCNRVDEYYCPTAISGFAHGIRVDRNPSECFSAAQASNPLYVKKIIRRNGTRCPTNAPFMTGLKLQKTDTCWRVTAVYCDAFWED